MDGFPSAILQRHALLTAYDFLPAISGPASWEHPGDRAFVFSMLRITPFEEAIPFIVRTWSEWLPERDKTF